MPLFPENTERQEDSETGNTEKQSESETWGARQGEQDRESERKTETEREQEKGRGLGREKKGKNDFVEEKSLFTAKTKEAYK